MQLQPHGLRRVVCAAWGGRGAQSPFNYFLKLAINLCLSTYLPGNTASASCSLQYADPYNIPKKHGQSQQRLQQVP